MARPRLDLGQNGPIEAVPQHRVDGKWKKAASGRAAERWRARAGYRDHSGTYRDVQANGPTQVKAIRAVETKVAELNTASGGDEFLKPSTPLLVAGEQWFARIQRPDSGISERSASDYRKNWDRYVDKPGSSLRGLTLAQANDTQRLTRFLIHVADNHGTSAAQMCKTVLSGIFKSAVRAGVLPMNATVHVGKVKARTPYSDGRDRRRAFTRAERDAVVAYAFERSERSANPRTQRTRYATAILVALLAATGARINEVRTLRWEDLDRDSGRLVVRGTKTAGSLRSVNLPGWCLDYLEEYGEARGRAGYILSSPAHLDEPERLWEQSNSAGAVRRVLDEAGLTFAIPHTFRRSVATMLSEAGVPLQQIADQLGHIDPTMTARVYLGRDPEGDKSALAALL